MTRLKKFKPVNRHLWIVPHKSKKKQRESSVLLPEDYEEESGYLVATVLDVASDCSSEFRQMKFNRVENSEVVVQRSMIQEVEVGDKIHYLILENYVLGIITNV